MIGDSDSLTLCQGRIAAILLLEGTCSYARGRHMEGPHTLTIADYLENADFYQTAETKAASPTPAEQLSRSPSR